MDFPCFSGLMLVVCNKISNRNMSWYIERIISAYSIFRCKFKNKREIGDVISLDNLHVDHRDASKDVESQYEKIFVNKFFGHRFRLCFY